MLSALHFAADKHRKQKRKDEDKNPYINHPIAVARLLATTGAMSDITVLTAAVLHDTIEDTDTTVEELESAFGADVRHLVEVVTDDKSLEKQVRKELQIEHAPGMSPAAKMLKLADLNCNLADIIDNPPASWSRERRSDYLDWTESVIAGCRGTNSGLEEHYDQLLLRERSALTEG